jgi:hypothetical protein
MKMLDNYKDADCEVLDTRPTQAMPEREPGEVLSEAVRSVLLAHLPLETIDEEFRPLVLRINSLPFAATTQSCVGHIPYGRAVKKRDRPPHASKHWGYLQLMVTGTVVDWLHGRAQSWPWLWVHGSQMFIEGANCPGVTEFDDYLIAFAWDSASWPRAGHDITEALEEFVAVDADMVEIAKEYGRYRDR